MDIHGFPVRLIEHFLQDFQCRPWGCVDIFWNSTIAGLTLTMLFDCMWITGYVPSLVIEATVRKKSSMVRTGSLAWRSLRRMNIFMLTDDSSLEVCFLEHKEMLFV